MGQLISGQIIELVGSGFGRAARIGGAAAGVGIATGLDAGICATDQAAEEEGSRTADEVDRVLQRTAADMSDLLGEPMEDDVIATAPADCDGVIEQLRTVDG